MMRLKIVEESLGLLVRSVAQEHYVTTPTDLEKMKNLHQEGLLKEMGEIALALFYQLQAPGTGEDGMDPNEKSRRALARMKEIFGLSSDVPPGFRGALASTPPPGGQHATDGPQEENDDRYPNITPAEWEARERPRQLLENILKRQVEACEEQRTALRQESLKGPSPYERAAEIAPTHPNARVTRRMQDSNFREVRRLTSLLLRLKRHRQKMDARGVDHEKDRDADE
jgi:hypothetical protein